MEFAETYSDKTALKLCAIQSIPKTCLRYHTQVDPPSKSLKNLLSTPKYEEKQCTNI